MIYIGKNFYNVDSMKCDPTDSKYQQCLQIKAETQDYLNENLALTNSFITWLAITQLFQTGCYISFFVKDTKQTRKLCIYAQLISIIGYIITAIFLVKSGN